MHKYFFAGIYCEYTYTNVRKQQHHTQDTHESTEKLIL